uniref:Uncharacterized protein n=1 Tax=Siphoviridae sp. ctHip2 TaxID=2827830 RepID=A0A8S5RVY6_9CAUD|nr:MAG TPA: hypothetical protein [Siphoviridae sp. ctHip2]
MFSFMIILYNKNFVLSTILIKIVKQKGAI